MATFRDKVIIIQRKRQSKWEDIYFVFSCNYWKIICSKKPSKNEKNLDSWCEISVEIDVKENLTIHNIKNIRIKSQFKYENTPYQTLEEYMKLLAYIKHNFPDGIQNYDTYEALELLNKEDPNKEKILLMHLKLVHINGLLPDLHKDETVTKILKFIRLEKPSKIIKLKGLNEKIKKELKALIN